MKCIKAFTKFVASNRQEPLVFPMPIIVFVKDLYLRAIENYMSPIWRSRKLNAIQSSRQTSKK